MEKELHELTESQGLVSYHLIENMNIESSNPLEVLAKIAEKCNELPEDIKEIYTTLTIEEESEVMIFVAKRIMQKEAYSDIKKKVS